MDNTTHLDLTYVINEFNEEDEPPSLKVEVSSASTSLIAHSAAKSKWNNDRIAISIRSAEFLHKYFPNSTERDWNSWTWQVKNSFTTSQELSRVLSLSSNEVNPNIDVNDSLPLRITPYYASLLSSEDSCQPLRKTVVPTLNELIFSDGEASDPLGEGHNSPVPNLVHRYPDRVLFLVTGFCSTYCRYCTRSHMVAKEKCHIGTKAWGKAIEYIKAHSEVRDVLISGGDALTMPDTHIEFLLSNLRSIPHVEYIRIGTKVPVVLPQRITRSLVNILKKYHPLFMSIHFTHPDEITPESKEACERLANAGIPLGSQTVLLKEVNDNVPTMKKLMHELLKCRVRPYYLYQCDPIKGSSHFRTSVSKGIEIIEGLRGHTSGYAVPHYVIDAPGGGGKIPILPEYFLGKNGKMITLRNYEGKIFQYPDVF